MSTSVASDSSEFVVILLQHMERRNREYVDACSKSEVDDSVTEDRFTSLTQCVELASILTDYLPLITLRQSSVLVDSLKRIMALPTQKEIVLDTSGKFFYTMIEYLVAVRNKFRRENIGIPDDVFCQVDEKWRNDFLGFIEGASTSHEFETELSRSGSELRKLLLQLLPENDVRQTTL